MLGSLLGMAGPIGGAMGGGGGSQIPSNTSTATATASATIGPISSGMSTLGTGAGVRGAFYNNAFSPGSSLSTAVTAPETPTVGFPIFGKGSDIASPAPYGSMMKWGVLGLIVLIAGLALLMKVRS